VEAEGHPIIVILAAGDGDAVGEFGDLEDAGLGGEFESFLKAAGD
jgi:hypothetical protein